MVGGDLVRWCLCSIDICVLFTLLHQLINEAMMMFNNIVVIGSQGEIGAAFIKLIKMHYPAAHITVFSRYGETYTHENMTAYNMDYSCEKSIANCANLAASTGPIDMVFVATGILHTDSVSPEKSLKDLSAEKLMTLFSANCVFPALLTKHFIPYLNKQQHSIFAALSARIGSISDNRLGGWYSYRASKAALNMIIKTAAIETQRVNKQAIIVGLHPGTVDSPLSQPFQNNIKKANLFSADYSAKQLLNVMNNLTPEHSGQCIDWDGKEIQP
ncbi:SDR family NAD(P)-dependent oxidoreductase [Vibrio sp. TH_r3]|uniref:SDR family NAD(P)-dependent oxidoreductase n=1 Tax=Vibrio sp. TH_r3 TaxID=3082084 RepID=UPI002954EA81|nr:SDR family NAD(P)-dependent oxidoreductase [Vibrio sp. TH_r3]MDV7105376.1 SDR family NAD(P)-dependent oxidoreductase [Vibrio sp. TH_r3]